jgi:hypothetical protein
MKNLKKDLTPFFYWAHINKILSTFLFKMFGAGLLVANLNFIPFAMFIAI